MNILKLFESKKFMKICSKTHQIAPFKIFFSGKHAPNPPSKCLATPRFASTQKSWPPLANPAYAHTLLLENLFEEIRS